MDNCADAVDQLLIGDLLSKVQSNEYYHNIHGEDFDLLALNISLYSFNWTLLKCSTLHVLQ